MADDGHAIHYTAVERGTPVYTSDEKVVGKVDEVVDNYDEHILDGIVIEDGDGKLRFVDGPEVSRTAERGVTLAITAEEVEQLPPPQKAPPRFSPGRSRGRLGRFFGGGGWKRH
jgi:sporulation protein YlmC with PRC-barrel domain